MDYLQHVYLYFLYRTIKDELVFKGGTCLQKTYGLNRFSDDLDFTKKGHARVKDIARNITAFGHETQIVTGKKNKSGATYLLKAKGPLYDGTEKSLAYIHLDISSREKPLLEPELKLVTPIYHDLPPYTLSAMKIEEIAAEKVRAIMTRDKARDVYDLWHLLRKGTSIDIDIVNKKLEYYAMEFDNRGFTEALKKRNKIWGQELNSLMHSPPDLREVNNEILKHFSRL